MIKVWACNGETSFGPSMQWIDTSSRFAMEKVASVNRHVPPALVDFIEKLHGTIPREKVAFYNRAVPAFESFGQNRNGDAFSRQMLMDFHPTFVKHAHYYRHHVNKNPEIAQGRPIASAFNDQTDMVDLIILADRDRVEDRIHLLERGEKVATSMGCHIKYDVCSICGNKAPTRAHYCEHVKKEASYPYGMNAILDDGRVCCVFNPNPVFFDLSDVNRGAATESETLMKVASMDIPSTEIAERLGIKSPNDLTFFLQKNAAEKGADMVKEVPTVSSRFARAPLKKIEPEIPGEVLRSIREKVGAAELIRHASALGIVLRPGEFSEATGRPSFKAPTIIMVRKSECLPPGAMGGRLNRDVIASLEPWFEKRSAFMPALHNRLSRLNKNAHISSDDSGLSDLLSGTGDEGTRNLYAAYRRSLSESFSPISREAETFVSKLAGTLCPQFPEFSQSYVDSAYLLSAGEVKVATETGPVDNAAAASGPVSGSFADELGQEVLGQMADNNLRWITSRRKNR